MDGIAGNATRFCVSWRRLTTRRTISVSHQLFVVSFLLSTKEIIDGLFTSGVHFVKINDKKLSKQYNIKSYPALTYFRNKEPIAYEGDLLDEDQVLEFLTSLEAMELPDQIEEVNAKILEKIVHDTDFVAVLFCKSRRRKQINVGQHVCS